MVNLHADDYGIDIEQAKGLIDLLAHEGSDGLTSVSIFANGPDFLEAAELIAPYIEQGDIDLSLHVNLVEGPSCEDPVNIDMLVNERGTFKNDFIKLLMLSYGPKKAELERQLVLEISAQIKAFIERFPQFQDSLRIDSHQHTHMVPAVFEALMKAAEVQGCTLRQVRVPIENKTLYGKSGHASEISFANNMKNVLLTRLSKKCVSQIPKTAYVPAFCGVLLSGSMDKVDAAFLAELEQAATVEGRDVEVLFHPVTVPIERCLDPQNTAFAEACASQGRDAETATIRSLCKGDS